MPEDHSYGGRPSPATVIAGGVRVEGEFSSQGDVLIEGEVHGNVTTSGMLTVGPQARLKAGVKAEKAIIAGVIEGNLEVGSHLDIKSTASILGDIVCQTATIESGATVDGRVIIGSKAAQNGAKHGAKGHDTKEAE
ncbi:MAG: polymer-forming cytoskeletal protein [Patescibacteria group bacterium]